MKVHAKFSGQSLRHKEKTMQTHYKMGNQEISENSRTSTKPMKLYYSSMKKQRQIMKNQRNIV